MTCEKCGKEHDGSYGSGRFCSERCARSFSGSGRSEESRKKTSISISRERVHVCPKCGKSFLNKGTSANAMCLDCKLEQQKQFTKCEIVDNKLVQHCKYCGAVKGQCKRPEICNHHQLFKKMVDLFHMDPNAIGTERIYAEYDRISLEIFDLYWNQKLSIQQMKDLVGYRSSAGSFAHFLSKFITFRTASNALGNALQTGRLKMPSVESRSFKTGFHSTWNNKRYFFRSSYEEDYCNELDSQHIDYELETLAIQYFDSQKNKTRIAIPDFYLPEKNLIVEVKSAYTLDRQNMIDKFLAYKKLGYNVELLHEHKHYPDMSYFKSTDQT